MMKFVLGFSFILSSFLAQAAPASKDTPKGRIVNEGAIVYTQADFDSPVMTYLKVNQTLPMSTKLFGGAFYKVLYAKGKMGYIADTDISPLWKNTAAAGAKKKKIVAQNPEPKSRRRPMSITPYGGLSVMRLNYREETMGKNLTEDRMFYGIKLTGPDVVISGNIITELDFIFSPGAPSYYEKYTGRQANGMIFIGDFLFESMFPQGPNSVFFVGFGPMFRYSKFNLQVNSGGVITPYAAEDMALGAVFNAGAAARIGNVALRAELRYNWEKERYFGYGLSVQMGF